MIYMEDFSSPDKSNACEEKHQWKIRKALNK
jgi:hypothetical protein